MTMSGVVDSVTSGLRTAVTQPVEAYWRMEPPKVLTAFVVPREEPGEVSEGIGGLWASGMDLDVVCEVPWDDKVATGTALSGLVEAVKTWVAANRSLVVGYVLRYETVQYRYVQRPGAAKMAFAAVVPLSVRPPKNLR